MLRRWCPRHTIGNNERGRNVANTGSRLGRGAKRWPRALGGRGSGPCSFDQFVSAPSPFPELSSHVARTSSLSKGTQMSVSPPDMCDNLQRLSACHYSPYNNKPEGPCPCAGTCIYAYQDSSFISHATHLSIICTPKGHHNRTGSFGIQRPSPLVRVTITHHCTAFTSCNNTCDCDSVPNRTHH